MRTLLLSVFAAGLLTQAPANASPEAYDICQYMANSGYSSSANTCLSTLSRGYADPQVARVCRAMSRAGYNSNALTCLDKAVRFGNRVNPAAMALCERLVSQGYNSSALTCIDNLSRPDAEYTEPSALQVCDQMLTSGYQSSALTCLQKIAGRSFDPAATALCRRMVSSGYSSSGLSCLDAVANKSYDYGIEICSTMITRGSVSSALTCLQQSGRPGRPYPSPGGGYTNFPGYPSYPSYPVEPPRYVPAPPPSNTNPPTVRAGTCYVSQTGQWVDGDRFFSLVNEWTQRENRCAVARIHSVPYSGRVYDRTGRRVERDRGGLSNSDIDDVLRRNGLYGCERFTCTETR